MAKKLSNYHLNEKICTNNGLIYPWKNCFYGNKDVTATATTLLLLLTAMATKY